jgi:[ribosomal protein S18]-alanine N-acetyltransferase
VSVIERLLRRDAADAGASASVTIEPMRRRDLRRGVMAIEAVSYPKPWSQNVFESELAQVRSGARCYLVARRPSGRGRDEIVGYAGLWFTADEAHVTNVAVRPDQQRSGIATALLLALADVAIERGCAAWTLEVRVSSTGAQDLYRTFGFNPAGVRARYYENTEDAIVMWCSDIQSDDYRARLDSLRAAREGRGAA